MQALYYTFSGFKFLPALNASNDINSKDRDSQLCTSHMGAACGAPIATSNITDHR